MRLKPLAWLGAACLTALLRLTGSGQAPDVGDSRVVLITLDGARTEEILGGLDREVLQSILSKGEVLETSPSYLRFGAATPEARREKLMPFFWRLMNEHGSIAGNRRLGSTATLGNRRWFSYPGYAEILLGEAHDEEIRSNDPIRNRFPTVLEAIRERLRLEPAQVASFASWSVFAEIVEHSEGATFVNAGVRSIAGATGDAALINRLQAETTTPWNGTRFDSFTFAQAIRYLESVRPRVLYLAFDETDDWAHDGRYDRTLEAYRRTDDYLQQLWTWLQAQSDYRGRTHLLITTDHGRGRTVADWRDHGAMVPGSDAVWIAFISPTMAQRGEWRDAPAVSTSQIASTIATWMGVDWNTDHPHAGPPIVEARPSTPR